MDDAGCFKGCFEKRIANVAHFIATGCVKDKKYSNNITGVLCTTAATEKKINAAGKEPCCSETRLRMASKVANQTTFIPNEAEFGMNSAIVSNRKAAQRVDDCLCSKERVGQHWMVCDAMAESDAIQAVDCDDVVMRENDVVQVVDGLCDLGGRQRRGEAPITAMHCYGMPGRDVHTVDCTQPSFWRHVYDQNCKNDGAIGKHIACPQLANASDARAM